MSESSSVDPENPPFNFEGARRQAPGDPKSSDAIRFRRALTEIRDAAEEGDIDKVRDLARRALP